MSELTPSGVGLALCKRLLEEDHELHLCLACRNRSKAEAVRAALLASHPLAEVSLKAWLRGQAHLGLNPDIIACKRDIGQGTQSCGASVPSSSKWAYSCLPLQVQSGLNCMI